MRATPWAIRPASAGPGGPDGWERTRRAATVSRMRGRQDAEATIGVVDALEAATRAIASLQSVDDVLQVIVDQVRLLVGADYAALGTVHADGVIERFITSGMSRETRAAIGPLPRGHGFLGLIIKENRSFRIPDIAVDPRRHGFPPNHPPMHSFLGVPITVKGRSVGNLYLTDKSGAAEFSAADERARRDVRGPRRDRDRERPPARAGPAAGHRRRARAHQPGPPRRHHPEHLCGRPLARGHPRVRAGRPGRGRTTRRAGDRQPPPHDPGHPELHLRPPAGAPERGDPDDRARRDRRGVPPQLDDRCRAACRDDGRRTGPDDDGAPAGRRQRGPVQHRAPLGGIARDGLDQRRTRRQPAASDRGQRARVRSDRRSEAWATRGWPTCAPAWPRLVRPWTSRAMRPARGSRSTDRPTEPHADEEIATP